MRKTVVLATAFFALVAFAWLFLRSDFYELQKRCVFGSSEAKVEILVFEDFRCSGCRKFYDTILREIRSRFVEPGKARLVFIPLGFLPGSKPLANAAIEVYRLAPEQFFPFCAVLFEHFGVELQKDPLHAALLDAADKIPGVDAEAFQQCSRAMCHEKEIDGNLRWAQKEMGDRFEVPTVFVNGIPLSTMDPEALFRWIEAQ